MVATDRTMEDIQAIELDKMKRKNKQDDAVNDLKRKR